MTTQLPDVDDLIKMAQDDPDGLERLRHELCTQLIENAPEHYQRRLNGIQFQIDMTRRKSSNGLHSCIKISEMMLESYQKLQSTLAELSEHDYRQYKVDKPKTSADIIDFKLASEKG